MDRTPFLLNYAKNNDRTRGWVFNNINEFGKHLATWINKGVELRFYKIEEVLKLLHKDQNRK